MKVTSAKVQNLKYYNLQFNFTLKSKLVLKINERTFSFHYIFFLAEIDDLLLHNNNKKIPKDGFQKF